MGWGGKGPKCQVKNILFTSCSVKMYLNSLLLEHEGSDDCVRFIMNRHNCTGGLRGIHLEGDKIVIIINKKPHDEL